MRIVKFVVIQLKFLILQMVITLQVFRLIQLNSNLTFYIFNYMTEEDIIKAQKSWSDGIIKMGKISKDRESLETYASNFLDRIYNFDEQVLFKPTKAKDIQFRNNKNSAISYFIGGKERECDEDKGFALSIWSKITFENSDIILAEESALAMGNYIFENDDSKIKVEFSFGYKKVNGLVKINLHHSSIPFQG